MIADQTPCPPVNDLERLLAEALSDSERDAVETHVEACTLCQDQLTRLSATNVHSVIPVVAGPAAVDPEPEGAFLERLRQLAQNPAAVAGRSNGEWRPTVPKPHPDPRFPDGRVGRYEVLDRIAVGGMGVVYRARHVDLDKVVALKVLPAGDVGELNVARFRNEMRAIGGLRHPNIVTAHDAGDANGVHYLAMDFVDGVDLARLTRRHERLPVAEACEAIRQAALGLHHAFERGLVHRDLKPSNLMLARNGIVQVLDLGLARAAGAPAERLTITGALLGTADYLAPEQWEQPHKADVRADVYGLGCTLYHLLAGRPPFVGEKYANPMAKMRGHYEDSPPPITAARPDLPPGLAAILVRMLAKDPAARFQTPAEVAAALRPFAAGADLVRLLDSSGVAVESTIEAARTPGPATRETMPGSRGPRPGPSRRWYALPIAVAVLGLPFAGWHWWPRDHMPVVGPAVPVTIENLNVTHHRSVDRRRQDLGDIRDSEEIRPRDYVRVTAGLDRPGYCYLIAFNPDGSEQLCHPAFDDGDLGQARAVRPSQVTKIEFFPEPGFYFDLDKSGLQVFVLVTSRDPLPSYADWRTKVGPIPWRNVFDGGESRWQFDGREIAPLAKPRGKKKEVDAVPQAFRELIDFFKALDGLDAVRAVAFPVANTDRADRLKAIELDLARNARFEEAQEPIEDLIKHYEDEKGPHHWKTEETRRELGAIQAVAGRSPEDQAAYTRALRSFDRAGLLYRQGRYPEAADSAKDAIDTLGRCLGPHDPVFAKIALDYGGLLRNAGRPAEAEKVFRGALADITAALGDRDPSAATARVGLAATLDELDRPAESKPLLMEALAIGNRLYGEDHAGTAVVLNNLASHFERRGDFDEAEPHRRRAIDILLKAEGEDSPTTLTARHNFAYNLTNRGKLAEGETLYRRVLRVRQDVLPAGHPDIAMTCSNLASNLDQQGRHVEAGWLYGEVRELYLRRFGPDSPLTAIATNGLATNLNNQGKYADASPLYEALLDALGRTGRGRSRWAAIVHNNYSNNLKDLGRLPEALRHMEEARAIYKELLPDTHPDVAGCLNNLAVTLEAVNRPAEADKLLRQSVAALEEKLGKDNPQTIVAAANLAVLQHKRGKYDDADPALRESLEAHRQVLKEGHPETTWAYRNLAANHWARGDYAAAVALGPAALASFEAARQRISYAGLDRARRTDDISPLDYLAASAVRQRRWEEAWKYFEAGLARGLLDELAGRALTDDERARERQLFRDLDARPKERDETLRKIAQFQATLTAKYGVAAGTVLDLASIQKALLPDAALVAWLDLFGKPGMADPGGDHWAVVVRQKGSPVWVQLPAVDKAWGTVDTQAPDLVRKRLVSRSGATAEEAREAFQRLYQQRLAPVEKELAARDGLPAVRHLVVLPSGDMARVPVEALTDRYTVSYAPSATVFAWLHGDRPAQTDAPSLLAVGDPSFAAGGAARLPGTRIEVQAIAHQFARPRRLLGADASESNLDHLATTGELARYRFLHFATHGHLDPRQPLASTLALAEGGRLTAGRVLGTWKLRADLVTLSACDSGRGEHSGGEGYLGFAQALFRAGARATVVSLWPVDDRATTLLMTRFYENMLGHGKPAAGKAEALAEAKRWLRDLPAAEVEKLDRELTADMPRGNRREVGLPADPTAKPFERPHYWSAFILIGDSR
jgi:CHAT domain-containing protein